MKNHYQFPVIRNIADVLPHLKDRKEFAVTEKDGGYTVINYHVQMESTFPPVESDAEAILRECRGMIFSSKSGDIMSRRYHKFFNAAEREETSLQFIDLGQPHCILDKLDGSMITPLVVDGFIRWGTKMGLTDTSVEVEKFIDKNPHYVEFAAQCFAEQATPIFEWCSRKAKIVLDYEEDQLILTAVRDTMTGKYMPYLAMQALGLLAGIPVVKAMPVSDGHNINSFIESVRALEDTEGFVIRFDDGHMVKVKCEWYLQLHHAKDITRFEKNVLEIILEEKLDDLLPLLKPEDQEIVKKYANDVWVGLRTVSVELEALYEHIMKSLDNTTEKRRFAVHGVKEMISDKKLHGYMYSRWDGESIYDCLIEDMKKSCSSQNRVDNNRWMMNGATYKLNSVEE